MSEETNHVIRIPMPWGGDTYDINTDSVKFERQEFVIGWKVKMRVLHIRIGWKFIAIGQCNHYFDSNSGHIR